jgi:citrate lyase subunit beta / citryl-CoA lyase
VWSTPRSALSVPAGDERKVGHATAGPADEVILDLEDAVPPAQKTDALAWLVSRRWSGVRAELTVRVNAARSPWCHQEIAALAAADLPFRALLVPKVESAGDLAFAERLLDGCEAAAGRTTPLVLHALIETAAGIAALGEIARASRRLERLTLGYADLGASLGRSSGQDWTFYQESLLTHARARGLTAFDGPYLGVDDGPAFQATVARAAELGFDGKWVIHPRQLAAVNARFSPSEEQVAHARRVVQALDEAHRTGVGAVSLDGQMIDEALAVGARRVLARGTRADGDLLDPGTRH